MKKSIHNLNLICLLLIAIGCTKEIDLDLPAFEQKPVIEGYIENGAYPWVGITYNQPYLEPINFSSFDPKDPLFIDKLKNFFVLDALVIVDNGLITDTLKLTVDPIILNGGMTYPQIKYIGKKFKGDIYGKYTLKVNIHGYEYSATTTITKPIKADSIFFKKNYPTDTLGTLHACITDDANEENFYRYYTKRIGRDDDFIPGAIMPINDKYFNGKSFEIPLIRGAGFNRYTEINDLHNGLFLEGDSVIIKSVTMDHDSFWFWSTMSGSGMGGSVAPAKTNIKGGALGVWCGYGVYFETVICQNQKP